MNADTQRTSTAIMEKYTKWRDAGTGIAPFLPVNAPDFSYGSLPFRVLTCIIKSILVLVAGLLFLLVDSFFRFSLGNVSTSAFEGLRWVSARFFLFISGFYQIPVAFEGRKPSKPKAGDIVIANMTSPIDVMLLVYLYPSALFTAGDIEMLYQPQSALSAFFARFYTTRVRKGVPIQDLRRQYKDRVIIICPEATTSNNRGLLSFCPLMVDSAFVVSIKYNNPPYLATPLPGQQLNFFWGLTSLLSHHCRIKGSGHKLTGEFAEAISRYARIPRTGLDIGDKDEFLAVWNKRR